MNYLREDLTDEENHYGLVGGAIGLSIIFVLLSTFAIPRPQHLNTFIMVMFGSTLVIIGYVVIKLRHLHRNGKVILPPRLVFAMMSMLAIELSILEAMTGGPSTVFRLATVALAVYAGMIGDKTFVRLYCTLLVVTFTWSMWENGERGGLLVSSALIMGAVVTVTPMMVRVPLLGYTTVQRSRHALDHLIDTVADLETLEQGLDRCLPMVNSIIPIHRIVVYVRPVAASEFEVLAAWPHPGEDDMNLVAGTRFARCVETGECVYDGEIEIVPVGETVSGNLVLALELNRSADNPMPVTFGREMGENLTDVFVRLVNQVYSLKSGGDRSRTDPLTGLANRKALEQRANIEMENALTGGWSISVAILEANLSEIPKGLYGSVGGEGSMRRLAGEMAKQLKGRDFLARFGGDRFCAILPDTDLREAHLLIASLREKAGQIDRNSPVRITAGAAMWDRREDFATLTLRAESALYAAKNEDQGKTRRISDIA